MCVCVCVCVCVHGLSACDALGGGDYRCGYTAVPCTKYVSVLHIKHKRIESVTLFKYTSAVTPYTYAYTISIATSPTRGLVRLVIFVSEPSREELERSAWFELWNHVP